MHDSLNRLKSAHIARYAIVLLSAATLACESEPAVQEIDLFNGREDLRRGVIRAVGDPKARFAEDGLRPYRAARFAAQLDFAIDGKTFRAMTESLEAARQVSMERVRDEFNKILLSPVPSKALELLRTSGLLALFCPELAACAGVEQNQF